MARSFRALAEHTVASDALWPRDEAHRYRLYCRDHDGLRVLAAAPDAGGLGQAIVTLHADAKAVGRRLNDEGQIGVLDVLGGTDGRGDWIILPFNERNPHA